MPTWRWKSNVGAKIRKNARDHEKRQAEEQRLLRVQHGALSIKVKELMEKYAGPKGIQIDSYEPRTGKAQFSKNGYICILDIKSIDDEIAKNLADNLAQGFDSVEGNAMAIDPYRKSRRIRNVIQESKQLLGIVQGTMSLEGQGMDQKRGREIQKLIIRRLWDGGNCNIWQGPKGDPNA